MITLTVDADVTCDHCHRDTPLDGDKLRPGQDLVCRHCGALLFTYAEAKQKLQKLERELEQGAEEALKRGFSE